MRGFIDGKQPIAAGGSVGVAAVVQQPQERGLLVIDYNDLASGTNLHAQIEEVGYFGELTPAAEFQIPKFVALLISYSRTGALCCMLGFWR